MVDYWINPKREAVGVVAVSDQDMSILYQVNDDEKEFFRQAMARGVPLRQASTGPRSVLQLRDLTSVGLSPRWRCLTLAYTEAGKEHRHYLYLWDRDTYERVVDVLRRRLGPGWEIVKG